MKTPFLKSKWFSLPGWQQATWLISIGATIWTFAAFGQRMTGGMVYKRYLVEEVAVVPNGNLLIGVGECRSILDGVKAEMWAWNPKTGQHLWTVRSVSRHPENYVLLAVSPDSLRYATYRANLYSADYNSPTLTILYTDDGTPDFIVPLDKQEHQPVRLRFTKDSEYVVLTYTNYEVRYERQARFYGRGKRVANSTKNHPMFNKSGETRLQNVKAEIFPINEENGPATTVVARFKNGRSVTMARPETKPQRYE